MGRQPSAGRRNVVRQERLAASLTQAALATAVGVSRQTVVAVEAGDYAPSVYLALALARQLGTTVEALFGAGTQRAGTQRAGTQRAGTQRAGTQRAGTQRAEPEHATVGARTEQDL